MTRIRHTDPIIMTRYVGLLDSDTPPAHGPEPRALMRRPILGPKKPQILPHARTDRASRAC